MNVTPGVYRCTHFYDSETYEEGKPHVFTKMEWVRKE